MKTLKIEADSLQTESTHYDNQIKIELVNPHMSFLTEVSNYDMVSNSGDIDGLFESIIENDEEILHKYLVKSGYSFNKN